ncbi:MAG: glycosyltransferase family 2 protein [Vicinamibacterales bacterium]
MPEPLPPPTAGLDIVIVSYNVRDDLDRCLASLAADPATRPRRVTVVDNASDDGTLAHLRQRWPAVAAIDAGANLGFARANNLGLRATTHPLVLLLNPDTTVGRGQIDRLAAALEADPGAAAAGPRLVDAEGRPEISFGPPLSPWGEFRQRRLMRAYAAGTAWAVARVARETTRPGPRAWLSAACLLVRRADLEAVGLLDERFFMYTEDVDLCVSLGARGRRVIFVPEATISHWRGRAGAGDPTATARRRRDSHLAYYRKHHPGWAPLLAWWLRRRGFDVR